MATNNAANNVTATTGKVLQGAGVGVASTFSTATYPSTATGTGKILRADGTNWAASTATYPDTAGTSGNVLTSDGTNWISSSAALPSQLNVASVTLTSQQIKSLVATPIDLIPAPGAGKVICLVYPFHISKVYGGSNVFVAGAGQLISIRYGLTTSTGVSIPNAQIISTASNIMSFTAATIAPTTLSSAYDNLAVKIVNSTVTEISGNAANDNTITITSVYYIITL